MYHEWSSWMIHGYSKISSSNFTSSILVYVEIISDPSNRMSWELVFQKVHVALKTQSVSSQQLRELRRSSSKCPNVLEIPLTSWACQNNFSSNKLGHIIFWQTSANRSFGLIFQNWLLIRMPAETSFMCMKQSSESSCGSSFWCKQYWWNQPDVGINLSGEESIVCVIPGVLKIEVMGIEHTVYVAYVASPDWYQ